MDVSEETWLTTGEAAKIAYRDIRTVRRWADTGIIRSRTSPGGHRQIALSSLIQAQPPPGQRVRPRAPTIPPDEAIPQWAAAAADWYGWSPDLHDSNRNLESLLINAQDLAASIRDVQQAIHSELRHRDESEAVETSSWTSTAMPATNSAREVVPSQPTSQFPATQLLATRAKVTATSDAWPSLTTTAEES